MKTPKQIGDYRVITLLGVGASSTVYRALRPDDGLQVAIKVLADNHSAVVESRRRFTDESRLLSAVDHPAIASIYDAGETDDGQPYMVLELANRGDLRSRVADLAERGHRIEADDVRSVAGHLRDALSALHAQGVVHRDLSPSNVLIRGDAMAGRPPMVHHQSLLEPGERFLLGDLGFAKQLNDASGLTRGGGTEGFSAPEQRSPVSIVDHRADLYSATALIRWLVAGTSMSPALDRFFDTGLAVEPGSRHTDIDHWHADLDESLAEDATSGPFPTDQRLRPKMWLLVPVLAIAVAAAGWLWWPTPTADLGEAPLGPGTNNSTRSTAIVTSSPTSPTTASPTTASPTTPTSAPSTTTSSSPTTASPTAPTSAPTSSTATATTPSTDDPFPFSPRAAIVTPADGAEVTGELMVSGTARASGGIEHVEMVIRHLDSGRYWHNDPGELRDEFVRFPVAVVSRGATESTWTYEVAPGTLPAGTYRLRVWGRAVDGSGDPVSDSRTVTIRG